MNEVRKMFYRRITVAIIFVGVSLATFFSLQNILGLYENGQVVQELEPTLTKTTVFDSDTVLHMGASEYGLAVVEQFLMQFPTIFATPANRPPLQVGESSIHAIPRQHGIELEDGSFRHGWDRNLGDFIISHERLFRLGARTLDYDIYGVFAEPILTDQIPDIFFRGTEIWANSGFYTSDDVRIENAPWVFDWYYATEFSLWDFDGSGIPYVRIYYRGADYGSGHGAEPTSFFRYINGSFERVAIFQFSLFPELNYIGSETSYGWFPFQDFLLDSHGNLIAYYYGIFEPNPFYMYITFSDNIAYVEPIAVAYRKRDGGEQYIWTNFQTGQTNIEAQAHGFIFDQVGWQWVRRPSVARYIPGTTELVTPITPLADLHDYITENITQYLLSIGAIGN